MCIRDRFYTLLTIGDGLVAQIPALLLSTAAAIIVTRASGSQDIGQQVAQQLFGKPQTLAITAGIIGILGLIPGMPNLVFLGLAGGAGYLAWRMRAKRRAEPGLPTLSGLAEPGAAAEGLDTVSYTHLDGYKGQRRMTQKEGRDEMKDSEGKPEVKGRIRRLQQEFARRRMMDKVPTADVIVTNPTHYAVALQYRPETMKAPVIIALGVEQVALRIRELGTRHRIPRVDSPLLARALYYNLSLIHI